MSLKSLISEIKKQAATYFDNEEQVHASNATSNELERQLSAQPNGQVLQKAYQQKISIGYTPEQVRERIEDVLHLLDLSSNPIKALVNASLLLKMDTQIQKPVNPLLKNVHGLIEREKAKALNQMSEQLKSRDSVLFKPERSNKQKI